MKAVYFACLALLGLYGPVVLGQATAEQLEEIIVSAEFRPVGLQDQAASTTVVTAEAIRQRAAQHIEDILNLAPNVNYASGASRARFYQIRGIGERSQFQEPLNPSIGFVVDDIDFSGLGTAGTLFDVAQVEILRGPQGTLHGANALAGLINVRTRDPVAEPYNRLALMGADYGTWSAGLASSGPLGSEQLLYRLALNSYHSDGYIENDYLGRKDTNDHSETNLRGKLRWLPNASSSLDMSLMHIDIDNGYDAFSLDNTRRTLSDEPGHDRLETTAMALAWRSTPAAVKLAATLTAARSETDYAYDEDWSYSGLHPDSYSSTDQYLRQRDSYSGELRLLSTERSALFANTTDWVVGLYYLGNREDLQRNYTYLPDGFSSRYDTDTLALFGQLDTSLAERLTLLLGLRLEDRQTDYSDSNAVAFDPDKQLWGGRMVLEYHWSPDVLVYGGLSRGYRANGVNAEILASMDATDDPDIRAQLAGVREYDQESLLNYELGLKGSFAAGRAQLRLALFYMDRDDQQVKGSFVIDQPDGGTSFIDYTNNAARGNNYGAELEFDWAPLERLRLNANLGLLRTEFEDYINADGQDLSGRDQAHAPRYQYALGGRYEFRGGFYLRLDLEGKDDFYFSDRHATTAPAYDLLHARLGYDSEHWSLALWARNLTDEDYYSRGFGSFGNDPRKGYVTEPYYQFGEPRVLGVSASYLF